MLLTEYEPLNLLNRLQQQFNNLNWQLPAKLGDEESNIVTSRWIPAVDIKEEDDRFIFLADIPGVDPKDIEVTAENGTLTIKGERKAESKEEREGYKRIERSYGSYYRRFSLPDSADAENIKANSKNGVLELVIPKHEVGKARRITVKA